jgi:two-component system cell cycle response regulator
MEERSRPVHRVLVVEDEKEMRELLRIELEDEGFQVLTAADGAEGIQTARAHRPDVILMDVQLPVVNGVEATRELKGDDDTRRIPVLIITALEGKEDVIRGLEAGANDYVTKPFFLPELKARIRSVLRFKRIHDELWSVRERLIKEQMLNALQEAIRNLQEAVDDNLAFMNKKADTIQQKCGDAVKEDVKEMADAASNIRNTVQNLSSLDSIVFRVYQGISDIIESAD